jgi:hypothetical protein
VKTKKEKTTMAESTEATQRSGETKMPHTWQKAMEMWDAGDPVPAFQVESTGATQEALWGAAFDRLRDQANVDSDLKQFSVRELAVIDSIVQVAKMVSWPQMINSHVHAQSPSLVIRNPEKEKKRDE